MSTALEQLAIGLANGSIYAAMGLALVLVYKGSHVLNVAQGEMALFAAYIAWWLMNLGLPLPVAYAGALLVAFAMGVALRYLLVPVQGSGGELSVLIVTLGVFLALNSLDGRLWGDLPLALGSPFSDSVIRFSGVALTWHQAGMLGVIAALMIVVTGFFQFSRAGLYLRAAAENELSARLSGIPVSRALALGWGLAAVVGAVGGLLIAHITFLSPPVMFGVLIYAVASAILGGFDSPLGAVVGGLIVGVVESVSSFYVPFVGNDLKIVAPILIIVLVVLVRPQGIFGTQAVGRL